MPRKEFEAFTRLDASDVNEYLVNEGYQIVETLYYTSDGTFTKATYPYLRAIKVKVQGAGGGAGAAQATSASQHSQGASGAGGAYAESFITDIASLDASVTVTIGAGGTGGTTSPTTGNSGGNSSFGALVSANGGSGNTSLLTTTFPNHVTGTIAGATTATGDLVIPGGSPAPGSISDLNRGLTALGGSSFLGSPNRGRGIAANGFDGLPGLGYGSGGSGPGNGASQATVRTGGNGAPGIVILELFA
jgi:hypothetical protein